MKIIYIQQILICVSFLLFTDAGHAKDDNNPSEFQPVFSKILVLKPEEFIVEKFDSRLKPLALKIKENIITDSPSAASASPSNKQHCDVVLKQLQDQEKNLIRGLKDEIGILKAAHFESCKDLEKAEEAYNNALKLRRNNPFALYRLVTIYLRKNEFQKASTLIQEVRWHGIKEEYLLKYLEGIIDASQEKYSEALAHFRSSLAINAFYTPTAKAIYHTKLQLKKTTKNKGIIKQLDQELPGDLGLVARLDPSNIEYVMPYIKHLLVTGDSLRSPNKLKEGEDIVDRWLKAKPTNINEFALLKIQFLEKQNKKNEALKFIEGFQETNSLTELLRIKKSQLTPVVE